MKIRKGEVKIYISPNDWIKYRNAGWKRMQEPSIEKIKQYNENRMRKEKEDANKLETITIDNE